MTHSFAIWIKAFCVTCVTYFAAGLSTSAYAVELGTVVTNVAELTYSYEGAEPITVLTQPAIFTVEALPTNSTIEFFRYAPNADSAISELINGSDFSPTGELDGPFTAVSDVSNGGANVKFDGPTPLTPASTYATGELMFVRVKDAGQNGNSDIIETVTILVTASTGDKVTLRLYESGLDTGEFWAYIPSTRDLTPVNDDELTTGADTQLTATYQDKFDATEISVDTALIDPYSRVFNSLTGDLIDQAIVTLIDMDTGAPATVFGVDGISDYPSSVTTGERISDSSGFTYDLRAGEFRFPQVLSGNYSVQVETPDGYTFSSIYQAEDFSGLANAPYQIFEASYGGEFELTVLGPTQFDIPLDPATDIILTKMAMPTIADVGDYIRYTVGVENAGTIAAPMSLLDIAPDGFRYVAGSSVISGAKIDDPVVDVSGNTLTYSLPILQPGERLDVSYVMQVGASVKIGESVNSALIIDGSGEGLSNVARAGVTLREDLLRSTSTIIGRVSERSCDADEDWAREVVQGIGVPGVRLYMETGAYTVSDQDGLYHFEGVRSGTHVVQVDEATLPQGYSLMVCEENSQYAGRARSKFVDVQGGGIWRANFYLERTGALAETVSEELYDDSTDYKNYDQAWLETQTVSPEWVYPLEGRTPSIPSVNLGIKHAPDQRVELVLNDHAVALTNYQGRDMNVARTVVLTRYRGIDVLDGKNVFVARVLNADDTLAREIRREIHYVTDIARATPLPDRSVLVADGRTVPIIAVRIEDEAGRPVNAGQRLTIDVAEPYQLEIDDRIEGENALTSPLSTRDVISVGSDGIAFIRLEPTLQTGRVSISVKLDTGRDVDVDMYLQPEQRDWILVGLAEGTVGLDRVRGREIALSDNNGDTLTDGRIAFFAKGLIKGNWLMTLAVDTDKRRGDHDTALFEDIDPNAYYTLYGDRTYEDHEAPSSYPVYVKLEKNTFYAMFGDYNTNMTETELTRYSRRLSGFKTEYSGERFEVVGFAAETNQGFAKDEIAANGNSGGYATSYAPVVINSEVIIVETRDRVRSDVVLDTKVLTRHFDYTIDYLTGEIIFRLPISATDTMLNPNVVVVDYETTRDSERNVTFGGRLTAKSEQGRVEASVSYIHEEGRADLPGGTSDVLGVDTVVQISEGTELRAEYAQSRTEMDAQSNTANAYLAEIIHTSEDIAVSAYIREQEAGFGTGQITSNTTATRRMGGDIAYRISENIDEDSGRRVLRNVQAQAFEEKNLSTNASRRVVETRLSQEGESVGGSLGLRYVDEELADESKRSSLLLTGAARLTNTRHGFTLTATHDQPLGEDENGSSLYPQRTVLGIDKALTPDASFSLRHEIIDGTNASGQNTVLGVNYTPWSGTSITAQSDMLTQDSAKRVGATVGVDQQWQLNEKWSASVGVSQRKNLSQSGTVNEIVSDDVLSPVQSANPDEYMSIYAGIGYRTDIMSGSTRVEWRDDEATDVFTGAAGVARELSETLSVAAKARTQMTQNHSEFDDIIGETRSSRTDLRAGIAWRPRDEDTVIFDRLDVSHQKDVDGAETTKIVNNFAANTMINDRTQATWNYGLKLTDTSFDNTSYSSTSHLLGGELRFDVTERIDLGLHGSMLTTDDGSSRSYAYGPSIGVSPVDNVWVSLGYNFEGYKDDDFEAAEYANEGLYLKVRLKFDQESAEGLLNRISPDGSVIESPSAAGPH